jgi:FtsH-binding integral membrane protein
MIAQLGIVFILSARVERLAAYTAALLFVAYSALTGATISFVLLAYTGESVATTFIITAGMFGAMAADGTTTRRSLAGFGQFFFMGLIGVVLASVVGLFWHSDALQFVISFIGVIVFTGLAAYDAQRMKSMALALPTGQTGSYAIVGGAGTLSRLHQPLSVPAAIYGQPAPIRSRRDRPHSSSAPHPGERDAPRTARS